MARTLSLSEGVVPRRVGRAREGDHRGPRRTVTVTVTVIDLYPVKFMEAGHLALPAAHPGESLGIESGILSKS